MPHINKNLIKKKYRSWDNNILSKLTIQKQNKSQNNKKRLLTKKQKTDSKVGAKWEQTSPVTDSTTDSKVGAKWEQKTIENKFFSLSGLQRQIIVFVYELCKFARDKKTDPLSICQIANKCNHAVKTVKNAINRLVKKNILFRNYFKTGRGGWTIYSIPNNIYQEILSLEHRDKETAKWEQSGSKLASKLASELVARGSSSSSTNIYKTTTTSDPKNLTEAQLAQKWQELDIEPLSQIGFTKTHLAQVISQDKLSIDMIQNSIYAFAFDLQENDKAKDIKGDSINYFMGILRNGKPYAPPSNYESPQGQALRLYTERMKEIEQKRISIEKEAMQLAFGNWFAQLNDIQKKDFLPANMRHNVKLEKNKMVESLAKAYFEAEVWGHKKQEIITTEIKTREVVDDNNITSK
jgi:predicted transcriptional regulator